MRLADPIPVLHYRLQHLEEIYGLSVRLARYFTYPSGAQAGIYELLLNALEHGNLGIGHALKTMLIEENRWQEEIERRLRLPEFRDLHVIIRLEQSEAQCRLTIADRGCGFDWRPYMSATANLPHRALGLVLARNAGFDAIRFNDAGNRVTCVSRIAAPR